MPGHPTNVNATEPFRLAASFMRSTSVFQRKSIAFAIRTTRYVFRRRTLGAAVLLALIPAAVAIRALAALAVVTAVCLLVVAYEAIRCADRVRLRHPELS
jgi:hypothetical protein